MKFFKSKTQIMWIRSLFVLISILLLVVTALTTWMINSFSKEISRLNYNLTSFVQKSVDTRLAEIENISSQIELHSANLSLSKLTHINEVESNIKHSFANQVRNYKLSNLYIDDIYIYYPTIDYVIGDVGSFHSKNYYLLNNQLKSEGLSDWISSLTKRTYNNYYFKDDKLMFSRQLPYNEFANVEANITIEINRDEIMKLLQSAGNSGSDSITAIISPGNRLYAATGQNAQEIIEALPIDTLADKEMVKHGDYYVLKRDSQINGMKYITIVNRAELLSSVYKTRSIAFLVIFSCLIIGLVMSLYVSKRNSKPLFSILNKVRSAGGVQATDSNAIDEYKLIENEIDGILNESVKSNFRLETQRSIIVSMFLTNVLSLELRSSHAIFALMQRLDLEFPYPQFVIMLIKNCEDKSWLERVKKHYSRYDFIASDFQGDMVLMVHVDTHVELQHIEEWAKEIQVLAMDSPHCLITIGGMYDSLSDIVTSYYQAHKVANMKHDSGESVLVYDVASMSGNIDGQQFSNMMADFNHYMDIQKYEEARMLADALLNQYVIQEEHAYLSRCRKYALINRVLDELQTYALQDQNVAFEPYLEILSGSISLQELRTTISDILLLIKEKQQFTADKQSSGVAQRAKDLIEKGYADPMIGLYSISEQLGVTNTYLSKVFKDTFGYGLAQYINMLRVEQAKTLILTTSYSVKEVSAKVGFTSDITFIRVFKQFTNTTPGKYKKQ